MNRLVDKGNTVIVIEHNLDVISQVNWIIDMGPDGGAGVAKLYLRRNLYNSFKRNILSQGNI
jgi:excinuclease UvrABC ATPase subunit